MSDEKSYTEVCNSLVGLPITYYPAILIFLIRVCIARNVFKRGRIGSFVSGIEEQLAELQEIQDLAGKPTEDPPLVVPVEYVGDDGSVAILPVDMNTGGVRPAVRPTAETTKGSKLRQF